MFEILCIPLATQNQMIINVLYCLLVFPQKTPAMSREYNAGCRLLGFYDNHDIWHFLSSMAMFLSFMVSAVLGKPLAFLLVHFRLRVCIYSFVGELAMKY